MSQAPGRAALSWIERGCMIASIMACAVDPSVESAPSPRSFARFSQAQIMATNAMDAWDLVAKLRPIALNAGGASLLDRTVYLDGSRLGGVQTLRGISARGLAEIRFLSGAEAVVLFGPTTSPGGAIVLTTKVGR